MDNTILGNLNLLLSKTNDEISMLDREEVK